jgi:hypothetical protein
MRITFERWLLRQRKRDDPIGDLANDFQAAKIMRPSTRQKCDIAHLDKWGACDDAYKTLKRAKKEYEKFINGLTDES